MLKRFFFVGTYIYIYIYGLQKKLEFLTTITYSINFDLTQKNFYIDKVLLSYYQKLKKGT